MASLAETPVRRGKPFWHYGKNFETVKSEISSVWIGRFSLPLITEKNWLDS